MLRWHLRTFLYKSALYYVFVTLSVVISNKKSTAQADLLFQMFTIKYLLILQEFNWWYFHCFCHLWCFTHVYLHDIFCLCYMLIFAWNNEIVTQCTHYLIKNNNQPPQRARVLSRRPLSTHLITNNIQWQY